MFLLLLLLISFSFYFVFLTWCLRLHARVLRRPFCVDSGNSMCFSYWKNVRLKPFCLPHSLWHRRFQLLLKECTIEALLVIFSSSSSSNGFSCYWKNVRLKLTKHAKSRKVTLVSVVIERMYDWSWFRFSLMKFFPVSVVIERMYDWSLSESLARSWSSKSFSCYWKNVRLKRINLLVVNNLFTSFSCYWKNVRLKLRNQLIENKRFLTVGFWSVFRKWSICTKSAIIFENLGWLLDCFW